MDLILCDDHPIVMTSMAAMFEAHGHRVVGTARHPRRLPELVRETGADVCVTDLLFDDEQAPEAVLPVITEVAPLADVVVITGASERHGDLARAAGAAAIGSKAMASNAMVALVEGRSATETAPPEVATDGQPPFFLTSREVEVLQSLSDGDSTARMAERLGVRHATARSHVQSVLLKLGVHNRMAAVAVGVAHDLVSTPVRAFER